MARSLGTSVRLEDLHGAVAALRVKSEGDISRLDDVSARAQLLGRAEKIRVRAAEMASKRDEARNLEAARRRPPQPAREAAGIVFSYAGMLKTAREQHSCS